MYYPQYGQDKNSERLGVPFRILPGTREFGRSEVIIRLVTRNTPIYTNKVSGELAQERRQRFELTSGKLLSQRAWMFTRLVKYR